MDRLEELREQWHTASEKDKPRDAVQVLVELERLEPDEPRWSQRLGEAYRRTGQGREAVDAFARAFLRYFERGFLPRAIAMATAALRAGATHIDAVEIHPEILALGHRHPERSYDDPRLTAR
jgi:predicted Zn-dependent protease